MDELLELARQGKAIDGTEPVALERLTEAVWRDVDGEGATLSVASSRRFLASESRLEQFLENLLQNAVTHGPACEADGAGAPGDERGTRGRDLTIRVGALPDGFYLEDDGVGIPSADRTRIFEQGVTSDPDGTGLGLAIVERIADAHGWTITATESDGGGARFEVTGVEHAPDGRRTDVPDARTASDPGDGHSDTSTAGGMDGIVRER